MKEQPANATGDQRLIVVVELLGVVADPMLPHRVQSSPKVNVRIYTILKKS